MRVPLPSLSDCTYAKPNPDGSRKKCGNCVMWITSGRCSIHSPSLEIKDTDVCGYHVFGQPMVKAMPHEGMMAVNAKTSGLIHTEDGTSCSNCIYYQAPQCMALEGEPKVEPLGCCSRWSNESRATVEPFNGGIQKAAAKTLLEDRR